MAKIKRKRIIIIGQFLMGSYMFNNEDTLEYSKKLTSSSSLCKINYCKLKLSEAISKLHSRLHSNQGLTLEQYNTVLPIYTEELNRINSFNTL